MTAKYSDTMTMTRLFCYGDCRKSRSFQWDTSPILHNSDSEVVYLMRTYLRTGDILSPVFVL